MDGVGKAFTFTFTTFVMALSQLPADNWTCLYHVVAVIIPG
jgi:hypothetical protein